MPLPDALADALPAAVLAAVAGHMGTLHGYERLLVLLIALGPFLVLGAVVLVVRRRDLAAEEASQDTERER